MNGTTNRRTFLNQIPLITATAAMRPALLASPGRKSTDEAVPIGSRRELFLDDFMIEQLSGRARLRLHHPVFREVVIEHDAPWEGNASGSHTVIQDGDGYRMYYRGWNFNTLPGKLVFDGKPVTCFARSQDGIHWVKPDLGIVEYEGSKQNNIIVDGIGTHNFMPVIDENPACRREERYKALAGIKREGGLFAYKSPDGIHWSLMQEEPVITNGAFDSANLGFWDPTIGQYRAYWRTFTGGVTEKDNWKPAGYRAIRTATSGDFLDWDNYADLTYVDSPEEHLYINNVAPYDRAPHILVGTPQRYIERGWSASMKALPDLEKRELRASSHQRFGTALTETLIMASRDGVKFKRWNEGFIRPGIQRDDSWYYAHQTVAWKMLETKADRAGAPNELSFYASSAYWHGKGGKMSRYTLRLDGFVSASAPMQGGELLTRVLKFEGSKLKVNFATSAAGTLKVEIQDAKGRPIPGYSLAEADETFGNEIDRTVSWNDSTDVSRIAGQAIRLRFTLQDADLYAFQFGE